MAIPQVSDQYSFNEWRLLTNALATSVGDFSLIYDVGQTSLILAVNDLNTRKANLAGSTFTGALQVNNTLGVTGTSTLAAINASGNIVVGSNKVTMNATSGDTVVAGTLDVAGVTGLGVLNVSGATTFTLSPTGPTPATNDNTTKLATTAYYIGQAGTASPLMNGDSALVGTSYLYSRQDHVHAHDTAKLNTANPTATGTLTLNGGTATVNTPFLSATQTWNGTGVSFSGITVDITNTASADTSLLLDFKLAGVNKFGVDVHGCVVQKLTGTFIARDVVSGSRHVREYQDLADSSVQGMDTSKNEWGYTWNAKWNGTSYDKDRNNAGDHAIMMRLTNGYKQHWWFSDGTTPGTISWVKKIDFDIPAGTYTFDGGVFGSTAAADTNTTQLATTAFVIGQGYLKSATAASTYSPIASPTFTGVLTTPAITLTGNTAYSGAGNLIFKNETTNVISSLAPVAFKVLGGKIDGSGYEFKQVTSSDSTILIDTSVAGVIDIKTTGIFPGSVSFTGDLTVGSPAKFTVAASTGNTVISGTLGVTGASILGSLSATSGVFSTTLNVSGTSTLAAVSATTGTFSGAVSTPAITASTVTVGSNTVMTESTLTTTSTAAGQVLASLAGATYRSATFEIQAVDSTGAKYHRVSIAAIHNGGSAESVEYGATALGNICGTFAVSYNGGNLELTVTPSSTNSTVFKISTKAIKV